MDVGIDSTDDATKPTRRRRVRRSTSSTVSLPDLDHSHATAIEALLTRVGELEFNIQSMEKNARKDLQVMDMRVEAALHCAVEATEAVRRNELQAKYAKGLDGRVPRDGEDARADEENVIPQTVDVESRQNLFTFALERSVMRPDLSALSVTREVVATAFLLWIQTIYCFGFEDASNLLQLQDHLSPYTARRLTHECPALCRFPLMKLMLCTLSFSPLHALNAPCPCPCPCPCGLCVCVRRRYADPVGIEYFYGRTAVDGFEGLAVPRINMAAALCSLVLLALSTKNDNESSLVTACPVDVLVFPSSYESSGGVVGDGCVSPLRKAHQFACLLLMQIMWSVRVALLPVLATLGSSAAFAASTNAQDIVLNSVAIAFVFVRVAFSFATALASSARARRTSRA